MRKNQNTEDSDWFLNNVFLLNSETNTLQNLWGQGLLKITVIHDYYKVSLSLSIHNFNRFIPINVQKVKYAWIKKNKLADVLIWFIEAGGLLEGDHGTVREKSGWVTDTYPKCQSKAISGYHYLGKKNRTPFFYNTTKKTSFLLNYLTQKIHSLPRIEHVIK